MTVSVRKPYTISMIKHNDVNVKKSVRYEVAKSVPTPIEKPVRKNHIMNDMNYSAEKILYNPINVPDNYNTVEKFEPTVPHPTENIPNFLNSITEKFIDNYKEFPKKKEDNHEEIAFAQSE